METNSNNSELLKMLKNKDFDFWGSYEKNKNGVEEIINSVLEKEDFDGVLNRLEAVESEGYEIAFRILHFLMLRNGGDGQEYTYEQYIRSSNEGDETRIDEIYDETQCGVKNFLDMFINWSSKQKDLGFFAQKAQNYDTKRLYNFVYTFLCTPVYFGLQEYKEPDKNQECLSLLNEIKRFFDSLKLESDIKHKILSLDEKTSVALDLVYVLRGRNNDEMIKLLASLMYIFNLNVKSNNINESLKRFWYEVSSDENVDIDKIKTKIQKCIESCIKFSESIKGKTTKLSNNINEIKSSSGNNINNTLEKLKPPIQVSNKSKISNAIDDR